MEYKMLDIEPWRGMEKAINDYAKDGWTVCAMNDRYIILQRPAKIEVWSDTLTEAITNQAG